MPAKFVPMGIDGVSTERNVQLHVSVTPKMKEHYEEMGGGAWLRRHILQSMLDSAEPESQVLSWRYKGNIQANMDRGAPLDQAMELKERYPKGVDIRPYRLKTCPAKWLAMYEFFLVKGEDIAMRETIDDDEAAKYQAMKDARMAPWAPSTATTTATTDEDDIDEI